MGVGEVPPPLGQGIHVRSDRLGVATHEAHPVVEVIDGNEQDIGFFISSSMGERKNQ